MGKTMRLEEHPCWHLVETKNGVAQRLGRVNSPAYFMSAECPEADREAYMAAPGGKKNHRLEIRPGWEMITETIYGDITDGAVEKLKEKFPKMAISNFVDSGVVGVQVTTYRHESGARYPEYSGRDIEKELEWNGIEIYNALLDTPIEATCTKCLRCGHEWYPRGRRPAMCPNPKCHSTRWDTPPSPSDPGPKRKKPAE